MHGICTDESVRIHIWASNFRAREKCNHVLGTCVLGERFSFSFKENVFGACEHVEAGVHVWDSAASPLCGEGHSLISEQ